MLPQLPFGRQTHLDEFANLVVFLASENPSYSSDLVIDADGTFMYAPQLITKYKPC